MASQDPALWQLTDYVIQEGDEITLTVDIRNSWNTTDVELILYYDDGGERVDASWTTHKFEGESDDAMSEYTVTLNAADVPDAVGHPLGIAIDNVSADGAFIEFDNVRLTNATGTSIEAAIVGRFVLHQNAPNPFRSSTSIAYELGEAADVTLEVFDLLGQRVRTLVRGREVTGGHQVRWNGSDAFGQPVPAGLYICRLSVRPLDSHAVSTLTKKMLLVK